MSPDNALDPYVRLGFFAGWSQHHIRQCARFGTVIDTDAGQVVCSDASTSQEFVLLLEGSAIIDGGPSHSARLGSGDHLGEIAMLVAPMPSATLIAVSRTRAFVMSTQEFRAVLTMTPAFARQLAIDLTRRANLVPSLPDPTRAKTPRHRPTPDDERIEFITPSESMHTAIHRWRTASK